MLLNFIRTVHVKNITMDLINVWSEHIIFSLQNIRLPNELTVVVVDVLSHQHTLAIIFSAILLELTDCLVALVRLAFGLDFIEVVVPLPDSGRIFRKKFLCQNCLWIVNPTVDSLPESILASEGWNSTSRAYPAPVKIRIFFFLLKDLQLP
jgi:hypothetical protein